MKAGEVIKVLRIEAPQVCKRRIIYSKRRKKKLEVGLVECSKD